MFSSNCLIELTFNYFIFFIIHLSKYSWTHTSFLIYYIIYSSSIDLWSFWNIFQDTCSSLLLLIVDFFVSYLLDQRSLIMKIVLGCDWKLSVGHIQTIHTYLIPPRACPRSWWGFWFCDCTFWNQYIDWLQGSSSSLKTNWWILGGLFINITEDFSFCWFPDI